jgi:hypothetical protein
MISSNSSRDSDAPDSDDGSAVTSEMLVTDSKEGDSVKKRKDNNTHVLYIQE